MMESDRTEPTTEAQNDILFVAPVRSVLLASVSRMDGSATNQLGLFDVSGGQIAIPRIETGRWVVHV